MASIRPSTRHMHFNWRVRVNRKICFILTNNRFQRAGPTSNRSDFDRYFVISKIYTAHDVFTAYTVRNVLFFGPRKCLKEFKSLEGVVSKRRFWSTLISLRKWTKINFLDQNQLLWTNSNFWHVIITLRVWYTCILFFSFQILPTTRCKLFSRILNG